jgi:hypothetical protein
MSKRERLELAIRVAQAYACHQNPNYGDVMSLKKLIVNPWEAEMEPDFLASCVVQREVWHDRDRQ